MATYSKGAVYTGTQITQNIGSIVIPVSGQHTLYQAPAAPVINKISGFVSLGTLLGVFFGPTTVWNDYRSYGFSADGIVTAWGTRTISSTPEIVNITGNLSYFKSGTNQHLIFNDYILRASDYIVIKNFGTSFPNDNFSCALTVTTISQA